jgi:hypothetical protein
MVHTVGARPCALLSVWFVIRTSSPKSGKHSQRIAGDVAHLASVGCREVPF